MKQFFITVIGTVVGIVTFFFLLFVFFMLLGTVASIGAASDEADGYVLTMDLRAPVQDHSAGTALFTQPPQSVVGIVRSLNAAKTDDDIKGLFIRAGEYGMVPASAEEIRLAIKDFKSSGKFVVTHSQGFETTSFTGYMAVSASDEIWQQDTTPFSVAGIRSSVGFYGGVFEKIDAEPQIVQFHEYKNAANAYNESEFTDAHREATTSLLTSLYETGMVHIAEDRKMTVDQIKTLLETAPHTAESAQAAGLTDKLGHYLAAKDYVKEKAGGDNIKFKSVRNYAPPTNFSDPVIAFVGGQGPVVAGQSADGSNPFSNVVAMGGDTVSEAIEAAANDKKVKAIVFRVSTPGGSATASDQIHDAVNRAQEAGKPVIISMGQYAASGGYYVSAGADSIVAMPMTITGSIGVLGGKVALGESFAKIGYNVEDVNIGGEFVSVFSEDEPFTESQYEAYRDQMAEIYTDFTTLVAEGRDIPLSRVQEIAKGRVWTGAQAEDLKLVDHQGGILRAIEIAKEMAEIDADSNVRIKVFPRPKTTQEQLEELFGASASLQSDVSTLHDIMALPEVQALIEARQALEPGQSLKADIPHIE